MSRTPNHPPTDAGQREALRRELLARIVRIEAQRRDQRKARQK